MNLKKYLSCFILLVFTFPGNLCLGQNKPDIGVKSGESLELREAKVARESAEKRILDLELELSSLRKEHDRLRSRYVDLYLKVQKHTQNLLDLELRAANLIQNKENDSATTINSDALQAMELVLSRQVELQDAFLDFQDYLNATIEAIQPSQAVKDGLSSRSKRLSNAIANSIKPLSTVGRSEPAALTSTSTILKVDDDLEIVILDHGSLAGNLPGKRWLLQGKENKDNVKLVTIDARPEIAAAAVTEGNFKALQNGLILVPDK